MDRNNNIKFVAELPKFVSNLLPNILLDYRIYQSEGLSKHIEKRHANCIDYIEKIPDIITNPDYVGVNPNEENTSFELVKIFDHNIQIGIKLDAKDGYLYVATLHEVTQAKISKRLSNGRLKNIDKS